MPSSVHVARADAIPLAVVRRRVQRSQLSTVVPQSCGLVWGFIRSQGLKGGRHVAIYLNGHIDVEVGVEMMSPFDEGGDVVRSATPAGVAASTVHHGPYQTLGDAHAAVREWCAAHGRQLTGVNWEIYGHWQPEWDDDPSRIRTDVFYQVAE